MAADDLTMQVAWFSHTQYKRNLNTLRPGQNGRHFVDDIFKCIFLKENVRILIKISLNFVPKCPINNIPALVQIMICCRPGDKPLSEPIMVSLLMLISITRPHWINVHYISNIHLISFPDRFSLFKGYSLYTWLLVLTQAIVGLIMSSIFKHGNNIMRLFVISCAMLVTTVLSMIIFSLQLNVYFIVSFILVCTALFLYHTKWMKLLFLWIYMYRLMRIIFMSLYFNLTHWPLVDFTANLDK